MLWELSSIILKPILWWAKDSEIFIVDRTTDPVTQVIEDTDAAWNSYCEYQEKYGTKFFPEYPSRSDWYFAVVMAMIEDGNYNLEVCTGK